MLPLYFSRGNTLKSEEVQLGDKLTQFITGRETNRV